MSGTTDGSGSDELTRAVAAAVAGVPLPPAAVNLVGVRRRGRSRRTARRVVVAVPVCAALLATGGLAWQQPWQQASLAPARTAPVDGGPGDPAPSDPPPSGAALSGGDGTGAGDRHQGHVRVIAGAVRDALAAADPGFPPEPATGDEVSVDGAGPAVFTVVVEDTRRRPATRVVVNLADLPRPPAGPAGASVLADATCRAARAPEVLSCEEETLAEGVHLVTEERRVESSAGDGTGAAFPAVRAVHPGGRVVRASAYLADDAATGARPSLSAEQLRTLVLHPDVLRVYLP